MIQTKEQDNTSEKVLNETEISIQPDKEFKVVVIKMFTKVRRRIHEYSENFKKELENIIMYQMQVTELKNTKTKLKNTLERINSRLDEEE